VNLREGSESRRSRDHSSRLGPSRDPVINLGAARPPSSRRVDPALRRGEIFAFATCGLLLWRMAGRKGIPSRDVGEDEKLV
jgi:hypothetical protein